MEMLGGNVGWKCWVEKLLVNGCEIIGEKIVATNLPLRAPTTVFFVFFLLNDDVLFYWKKI